MPPPYQQTPPSEVGGYRVWIVSSVPITQTPEAGASKLAAKLGLFDATMIVMGGAIGSGIFVNPAS